MAFFETPKRFGAPGAFGTTNLRSAIASARQAATERGVTPKIPASEVRCKFFESPRDPEAGPATDQVTAKQDPEAAPVSDRVTPKDEPTQLAFPSNVVNTCGAGPSGLIAGTLVETELGLTPVEQIEVGHRLPTDEGDLATVTWVSKVELPAVGDQAPVRFAKGILGNDRALVVSPLQRVLIEGPHVLKLSGRPDALIAAHALVDGKKITRLDGDVVTYVNLMLDRHCIIRAAQARVESFFPDIDRLTALPYAAITDFVQMHPKIAENPAVYGEPIRPVLKQLEVAASTPH